MGKTEQCAFCAAKADDGEHVWSDWFGRLLGPKAFHMIRKELDGNVKQWKSGKLNSKTKVVCGECNHTWMSDVENRTKSVIQQMAVSCQQKTLSPDDIEIIAQFAFLKTVVADHSHDNRKQPFFTLAERYNFRETLELPTGFQMWVASLPVQHGIFKSFYAVAPQNLPGRFEINAFTYGLGHFVIQVAACRWTKKLNRRFVPPPILTQSREWNPISIAVLPAASDSISWPPSAHMGRELIDQYAQRWKDAVPGWIEHPRA
jgi:hypothetical protein